MKIVVSSKKIEQENLDVLIVSQFQSQKNVSSHIKIFDEALNGVISRSVKEKEFVGKEGQMALFHNSSDKIKSKRILLLGLGKEKEFDFNKLRLVISKAVRKIKSLNVKSVGSVLHGVDEKKLDLLLTSKAIVESIILTVYKFSGIHQKKKNENEDIEDEKSNLSELILFSQGKNVSKIEEGIILGKIVGESCNFSRDLVMLPSNHLTPTNLAKEAIKLGKEISALKIKILEERDMKKLKMNALLGVSKGSKEPPKLILVEYKGGKTQDETMALVGKGVTFDSGGISIKPSKGMKEMTGDMGGAATVLGAMRSIALLKIKKNIIGIIPAVENMPDGRAQKPGDVVTTLNGKTVEVINTDAEGRLILCDALTYAQKLGAKKIIDFATLTGACIVALGHLYTAILGNDKKFIDQILEASNQSGEKMWQLPLDKDFFKLLKSDIADMTNCMEGGEAGTITAAEFLHQFIDEKIKWIHCDIAGTSDINKPVGIFTKGATGVGIRTIIELLRK